MKLIGNLKKQVEETKNKEEAKEVIEKAGMELTDEELDQVTGGISTSRSVWVPTEY
ncbi:MAG: bacteriocin [Candidatus Riflebacteria bacterium]|nr:bacteriocin [Candidatus Riflebacteria bacterium]